MIRFNRNIFLNNICLIYDMSVLQEAIFKNQYSLVLIITNQRLKAFNLGNIISDEHNIRGNN